MHIQIVNFQLSEMDETQYAEACEEEAPTFAALPGLAAKIWLADRATNAYGGVYLWHDRRAMQSFVASDLFRGIGTDPHIRNLTSREFAVLEAPTSITRGLIPAPV